MVISIINYPATGTVDFISVHQQISALSKIDVLESTKPPNAKITVIINLKHTAVFCL